MIGNSREPALTTFSVNESHLGHTRFQGRGVSIFRFKNIFNQILFTNILLLSIRPAWPFRPSILLHLITLHLCRLRMPIRFLTLSAIFHKYLPLKIHIKTWALRRLLILIFRLLVIAIDKLSLQSFKLLNNHLEIITFF